MAKKWFLLILFNISVLILVQIGLYFGGVREVFTKIDDLEGRSYKCIVDTVGLEEIELKMVNFTTENNTKILVNGVVSGYFHEPVLKITVKNNSLIEIDSTEDLNERTIEVVSHGEKLKFQFNTLKVKTRGNIVILDKVFC